MSDNLKGETGMFFCLTCSDLIYLAWEGVKLCYNLMLPAFF